MQTKYKLKILALLLFKITVQFSVFSQVENGLEVKLTSDLIDSLQNMAYFEVSNKRIVANNFYLMRQFNIIKRRIGQIDTIKVFKNGNRYSAYYRNKELDLNKRFTEEKNHIKIFRIESHSSIFLYFETFEENDKSQRITIFNNYLNSENDYIKIENFENEIISGLYRKLTLECEPRIIGNYILKDSVYNDTIKIFDSETYEESIKIINRKKAPIKCEEWLYFDEEGEIRKIKHIENCK